jgi:hypothetical protein
MIQFLLGEVCVKLMDIEEITARFKAIAVDGDAPLNKGHREDIERLLRHCEIICKALKLPNTQFMIVACRKTLSEGCDTVKAINPMAQTLYSRMKTDISQIKTTLLQSEKAKYFIGDAEDAIFGSDVYVALPDARSDIKSASNCIAADLNTAAVYHLMRTVEHGMRALARHLRVKVKGRTIESSDWGNLISAMKKKTPCLRLSFPQVTTIQIRLPCACSEILVVLKRKKGAASPVLAAIEGPDQTPNIGKYR